MLKGATPKNCLGGIEYSVWNSVSGRYIQIGGKKLFGFNFDKRILYGLLAVMALYMIMSAGQDGILGFLLALPAVLIAISFHEFAHAYTAYKLGDDTPKIQGRITLNPFRHLDIMGFLMLMFAHFGWGKPVQINPNRFDRKISLTAAEAIVAIAGPIMNFILSIIFTIVYALAVRYLSADFLDTGMGNAVLNIIYYIIWLNVGLGVFNLIPIPPLDGSKVLYHFLSYEGRSWFEKNQNVFYIVFLVVWIT